MSGRSQNVYAHKSCVTVMHCKYCQSQVAAAGEYLHHWTNISIRLHNKKKDLVEMKKTIDTHTQEEEVLIFC